MTRRLKTILWAAGLVLLAGAGVAFLGLRHASGSTLGQSVNAGIDNLVAMAVRLLELPLIVLLAGGGVLAVLLALPILRWGTQRGGGRLTLARVAAAAVAGVALMGLALIADHKIERLQGDVSELRGKLNQERMARLQAMNDAGTTPASAPAADPPALLAGAAPFPAPVPANIVNTAPVAAAPVKATSTAKAAKRDSFLFDAVQVPRNLSVLFGPVGFHPVVHDEATDVVEVDLQNLPAIAYMAVVNLQTPGLEIKYGGSLTQKTLTSDFARANDCQVAINGEAGASPQANSGLGVWHGNMIAAGQVLLKEDPSDRRPFLSFDRQSHATYTAQTATERLLGAAAYNVIWGRLDAVIDDRVQTENERDRQPRTAMGISKDGSKLYLMVVDGRQQRYSIGFTRQEVGMFLQTFGAANGMLCDEGGSSCIYMKKFAGIVNSPSDGVERPTYTHFGISLKAN